MKINQNTNFGTHNTSVRGGKIEWIVLHYVGATGDAKANIDYYNQKSSTRASADFFVGHNGDIWQYNPNPEKRYCWAVGGRKQSAYGGQFYGIAGNSNTVHIEMCVLNESGNLGANSSGWNLTLATRNSAVELTKYLMQKYDVDIDHVIRHFDVNGKACPGLNGWNTYPGNNEDRWLKFKKDVAGATVNVQITTQASETTTTTKNNFNQHVHDFQQSCNEDGIRDDNGNKLVEDGIWGKRSKEAAGNVVLSRKTYGKYIWLTAWVKIRIGAGLSGYFDEETEAAVIAYQKKKGLTPDGKVGAKTIAAIIADCM